MNFRTFCRKDEKNGDDDGTDSSAAPVTSDMPKEIEGLFLIFYIVSIYTVKPVYNDHSRDPKFVAVVERWSLFRDWLISWRPKLEFQNGGCCRQVVVIWRVVVSSGLTIIIF
jgi:hypothetical protein